MTTQMLESTIETWSREPARALGRPSVKARAQDRMVQLESGSFRWSADLPASLGGSNQAPSPTALLLSALAGCAVAFIKDTLAPQLGVRVYAVAATASCEADSRGLLGIEGVEPDLRSLRLDMEVESPDGEAAVDRVLAVWKERCPIYLALLRPVDVDIRVKTVDWYAAK